MSTISQGAAARPADASLASIVFVALLGVAIVFTTGFAHSQTLHDAAHDVRHATGFPCH